MWTTLNADMLPSPADQIVADFVKCICSIEPALVEGVYLTGSVPLQDFYPEKSDIDFVVLCRQMPDQAARAELVKIHKSFARHWPKPDLSGTYITCDVIAAKNPELFNALAWHEGRLLDKLFEMGPVTLTELKTSAYTVYGPPADSLPVSISREDLNRFLYQNINSYWKKWISKHSDYFKGKFILLLFPRFTEWSVLGVARLLYTLETGKIASKSDAGNYCITQLPEPYHTIFREALEIRKDSRTYPLLRTYAIRPSFERLQQTLACVNYMIARFNEVYLYGPKIMTDKDS